MAVRGTMTVGSNLGNGFRVTDPRPTIGWDQYNTYANNRNFQWWNPFRTATAFGRPVFPGQTWQGYWPPQAPVAQDTARPAGFEDKYNSLGGGFARPEMQARPAGFGEKNLRPGWEIAGSKYLNTGNNAPQAAYYPPGFLEYARANNPTNDPAIAERIRAQFDALPMTRNPIPATRTRPTNRRK